MIKMDQSKILTRLIKIEKLGVVGDPLHPHSDGCI